MPNKNESINICRCPLCGSYDVDTYGCIRWSCRCCGMYGGEDWESGGCVNAHVVVGTGTEWWQRIQDSTNSTTILWLNAEETEEGQDFNEQQ